MSTKFSFNPEAPEFVPAAQQPASTVRPAPANLYPPGFSFRPQESSFQLHPLDFENLLAPVLVRAQQASRQATMITEEAILAKIATGCCAFLNSFGYNTETVLRAVMYREYSPNTGHGRCLKEMIDLVQAIVSQERADRAEDRQNAR